MRLIYEKDGKFYRSESGIPEKDGTEIGLTREQVEGYALVYAKNGEIKASVSGIPNDDEDVVLYSLTIEESVGDDNEPETINDTEGEEDEPAAEPAANEEPDTKDATETE